MSKYTLWPSSTQVPLVISGGPFIGGQAVALPVSLADVFPTLVELIKVKPLNVLSGIDLARTLTGDGKKAVLVYSPYTPHRKAVVTKEWHFI